MMRDREFVQKLLQRAADAGCDTLMFTVDLAVVGARYRDVRNGLTSATGGLRKFGQLISHPSWLYDVGIRGKPHVFGNLAEFVPDARRIDAFKDWVDSQFDASTTWEDIAWLRSIWKGKLVIKGVLEPEDALAAMNVGADAIVVSNHGGRQLDGVRSAISMLPAVVDAVGGRAEVFVDGGIRSGQDIAKAIALGADGVMIGRPWIWAMAAHGEAGVSHLLQVMEEELRVTLALTGCTNLSELSPEMLDMD
mgnify:CR=1 FL=1